MKIFKAVYIAGALLAASAGNLTAQTCTVTVGGNNLASSPAPFREGGRIWAPVDAVQKAFDIKFADVSDASMKISGSDQSIARMTRGGKPFACITDTSKALDSSIIWKGNTAHILGKLKDVRFSQGKLLIETNIPVRFEVRRLTAPERIYVNLFGVQSQGPVQESRSETSLVRALRIGQFDDTTARVTAETTTRLEIQSTTSGRSQKIALALGKGPAPTAANQASNPNITTAPSDGLSVINNVDYLPSEDQIRFVFTADRPMAPKLSSNPAKGEYALEFARTAVSASDTNWKMDDGGPLVSASLSGVGTAPPTANMKVKTDRLLMARLLSSDAPNKIVLQLAPPRNATGDFHGKTIIIDAGHGGKDSGARGGVTEKDVNLAVSLMAAKEAEKRGLKAVLTRDSDIFRTLAYRTEQIAPSGASLFVSIHSNSNGRAGSVSGSEVYYHKQDPDGRLLAELVQKNLVDYTVIPGRGARSDTKLYKSGLFVLRTSSVPAILVELGYVNHSKDAAQLRSPAYQAQAARAIIDGVVTYLGGSLSQQEITAMIYPCMASAADSPLYRYW